LSEGSLGGKPLVGGKPRREASEGSLLSEGSLGGKPLVGGKPRREASCRREALEGSLLSEGMVRQVDNEGDLGKKKNVEQRFEII
jgi:hypothetical protein